MFICLLQLKMGSSTSRISLLTEDILDEYSILAYLSKSEILRLYKVFSFISPDKLQDANYRYTIEQVEEAFPQLKCNPFKDRIYRVFSSQKDNRLSFEDILDLYLVTSEKCPDRIKTEWAFRLFDYDEDDAVGAEDLMVVTETLTNSTDFFKVDHQKHTIEALLKEMDFETKGRIGQLEFQHAVEKLSEFPNYFFFQH